MDEDWESGKSVDKCESGCDATEWRHGTFVLFIVDPSEKNSQCYY